MAKRRPKASAEQLTTLLHLARLGAGASFAGISTRKLGSSIGISQQAASLRLIELERSGLVERAHSGRGLSLRLTRGGVTSVETFLTGINTALKNRKNQLEFTGILFTGMDEGRYYVSLKGYAGAFRRTLGFQPYPGTLNLRLTDEAMIYQRRQLDFLKGIEVAGFSDQNRSYGPVKVFKAKIAGRHQGAVLVIERTHYDSSVLEVIAPFSLREALKLDDGDECSLVVYTDTS